MATERHSLASLADALVAQEPWDVAASQARLERAAREFGRRLTPAQRDAWRVVLVTGLLPVLYLAGLLGLSLLRRTLAPGQAMGGDFMDRSMLVFAGPDSFETVGVFLSLAGLTAAGVLWRQRVFLAGLERGLAFVAVIACTLVMWRQTDGGLLLVPELFEALVLSLLPAGLSWFVLKVIDRTRQQIDDLIISSLQQELALAELREEIESRDG